MILYHGTSAKRGKQILDDKKIKGTDVERVYNPDYISLTTTDGYVYLGDFPLATYYANKTSIIADEDTHLMLFEVEIDDNLLEVDYDEIEYTLKPFNAI